MLEEESKSDNELMAGAFGSRESGLSDLINDQEQMDLPYHNQFS